MRTRGAHPRRVRERLLGVERRHLQGPRLLPAAALAPGRRGAQAVLRLGARTDRGERRRLRRRADALARGVHRGERAVGAGRAPAVLPPAHPPLPDPARGGADRPGPAQRPRPDRVLAGAARTGAGDAVRVGVPAEVKADEYRVALTPAGVRELADAGHEVFVQSGAGSGSAITDEAYGAQGATIVPDAATVFGEADLIVKVKEPQRAEVELLESRHVL